MNTIVYRNDGTWHRYTVGLSGGRSVEVLMRMRRSGLQVDGGEVSGVAKAEEVSTFREAADWLSRFVEQDGSPRPDILAAFRPPDPVSAEPSSVEPAREPEQEKPAPEGAKGRRGKDRRRPEGEAR